tara:strand:- start:1425 stop:4433 length:3009 start_codon:yes stop_codon:yes gene_type:complete
MGSNFTGLTVKWYDESNGYSGSGTDITADVLAIPLFTDTGSGEVNEANLVLSAKAGKYITTGNIIDKYDRIHITITDIASSPNTYSRFFEVTDIIPTQTKTEGSMLTLNCVGIEYHTQVIHYAKRSWFDTTYNVAKNIGDTYESNNGSRQPTIARHNSAYSTSTKYGNELPNWTNNHYEFGASEDSCYNRLMNLTTILGGNVTNGGVGDFFELGFDTPSVNAIDLALFTSGARQWNGNDPATTNDSGGVVIENTTSINVSEQEGGIANPTGTKVASWGSPVHGSLPVGTSKYAGHELEFSFRPEWKTSVTYKTGAKVIYNTKHYKALRETVGDTPSSSTSDWELIDMSSEFGDTVQYSEWTDDKAVLWANAGVDPDAVSSIPTWATSTSYTIGDLVKVGSSAYYVANKKHTSGSLSSDVSDEKIVPVDSQLKGNGASFFDQNIVVRDDGEMFRTWVNEVVGDTTYNGSSDQTFNNEYRYNGTSYSFAPPHHRFLNVGATMLTGNDARGKSFTNAVVSYNEPKGAGQAGQWEVVYEQPTATLNKMQVVDIKDRKIWEWDNTASEWQDKTTTTDDPSGDTNIIYRNDDCVHQYKSIYNIDGSDPRPTTLNTTPFNEDGNRFVKNHKSAVEVCYEFPNAGNDFISSTGDTKKGAWLNFGFPFPLSTYNGISEKVGEIYGGHDNQENGGGGITYPATLDTQNMSYTSDGNLGFNHSTSNELGQLSSLSFNMRVLINSADGNKQGGTAQVRCFMIDIFDNIQVQDFEMRFTDDLGVGKGFQTVNLPLSGFSTFRGRQPKNWFLRWADTILGIKLPIQELDVQDVFNEHSIKYIGFQINDYYDDEGRYDPQRNLQDVTNTGAMLTLGGTLRMAIDAFHFKKPLLVISDTQSVQNIEPQFLQRPMIMSYTQLQNEVNSQLEIEQFRHKEYNFKTSGNSIFDIRFGDTLFLKNAELVSDADYDETSLGAGNGTAGTVRLVAKRIEYHLTKPSAGAGGITRSIKGIKRFTV